MNSNTIFTTAAYSREWSSLFFITRPSERRFCALPGWLLKWLSYTINQRQTPKIKISEFRYFWTHLFIPLCQMLWRGGCG